MTSPSKADDFTEDGCSSEDKPREGRRDGQDASGDNGKVWQIVITQ